MKEKSGENTLRQPIQLIADKLRTYLDSKPVKRAYVFGSVARGEETLESDIDLLLELEYIKGIAKIYITILNDIPQLLKNDVDIITTESLSGYSKKIIEKERILIYEKK